MLKSGVFIPAPPGGRFIYTYTTNSGRKFVEDILLAYRIHHGVGSEDRLFSAEPFGIRTEADIPEFGRPTFLIIDANGLMFDSEFNQYKSVEQWKQAVEETEKAEAAKLQPVPF